MELVLWRYYESECTISFQLIWINDINEFLEVSDVNPYSIEIIQNIAYKLKQNPKENKKRTLSLKVEM